MNAELKTDALYLHPVHEATPVQSLDSR
jgi:hypothetical protein